METDGPGQTTVSLHFPGPTRGLVWFWRARRSLGVQEGMDQEQLLDKESRRVRKSRSWKKETGQYREGGLVGPCR